MANEKFQRALARSPQAVPPVWLMRQAGRYHHHYQALRKKHSFMELCKNPALAAQVALGPVEDFDFDLAILFSDLLFPLEAMGMGLKYDPAPQLGWQLDDDSQLTQLKRSEEALPLLAFQAEAMRETRKVLPPDKSLIGFVGGVWTLFAYAVEGGHKGELKEAKKRLRLFPKFLEILLPIIKGNIRLQLESGAEVVMILDTAAGELSPGVFKDLVAPAMVEMAREFPQRVGYYAKGVQRAHLDHELIRDPRLLAGLGFDHRWDMTEALQSYQNGFVQGNFDQSLLFLPTNELKIELERYFHGLRQLPVEKRAGWVCGLGHGVLPETPEENVRMFVRLVREVML